ncbi:hypothetical protein BBJ28_00016901 [Nothophytophthora sp. Chile5]|nr:hypothetical protein BBJ28_00016901 [Nothophytophthora sp. Chile5]
MVSATAILSVATALAACVARVQAHGYVSDPASEFTDSETANWIVQIEPQWTGDWDGADGDSGLVALYKELKASNNVDSIRTMLDSDTSLYGANCGFTNPDVTAKSAPTDGTATFSRGMVHAGPCEIWLDDTLVLSNDDCQSAYGDGTQEKASVFTPVDYSSCSSSGCMFRFYWLALQVLDGTTVWQVYKDCIPLSGPAGGATSTATTSSTTTDASSTTEAPSTDESSTTEAPATDASETSDESSTEAPEATTETPETSGDDESTEAPENSDNDEKSSEASEKDGSEEEKADDSEKDDEDEKSSEESKNDDDDDEKSSETADEAEGWSGDFGSWNNGWGDRNLRQ